MSTELRQSLQATATDRLIIFLRPGHDSSKIAKKFGLEQAGRFKSLPNAIVLRAPDKERALTVQWQLAQSSAVEKVFIDRVVHPSLFGFYPDDSFFMPYNAFPGQWHLINNFNSGPDIDVLSAWKRGLTGQGVIFGIVDDSLEPLHPDLNENYYGLLSWDFGQSDNDPSPEAASERHGIAVGGCAAARGGNGIGVTGVAPHASLVGLKCNFSGGTIESQLVDATMYQSSAGNANIKIKNHSYGYTLPFFNASAEQYALQTSAAAGTIHVFAAGNGRGTYINDSNKLMLQADPAAITVAAIGSNGTYASYSSFGANISCAAPSSTLYGVPITTTDRTGALGYSPADGFIDPDYTSSFTGTSAASPIAAGALILAKQANAQLDTRLAKHLLARSCRLIDPGDSSVDGGWHTNAAGFHFNQNYGFGLIDAGELTRLAFQYSGVTELQTESSGLQSYSDTIPDYPAPGVTKTFNFDSTTPLEEVQMFLDVEYAYRGDIVPVLTSPSGTSCRLVAHAFNDIGYTGLKWTFTSNKFWGENPQGQWSLTLTDVIADIPDIFGQYALPALWKSARLDLRMGSPIIASKTVTGNVDLVAFAGTPSTVPLAIKVWRAGETDEPILTVPITLEPNGNFSASINLIPGTYDFTLKGAKWLNKRQNGVIVDTDDIGSLDFIQLGGDADGDNKITILDYSCLASHFDISEDDPSWNEVSPETNTRPSDSDFDGDGWITIFDYSILATNFDLAGD